MAAEGGKRSALLWEQLGVVPGPLSAVPNSARRTPGRLGSPFQAELVAGSAVPGTGHVVCVRAHSRARAPSYTLVGAQPNDLSRTRATSPGPEQGLRVKSSGRGRGGRTHGQGASTAPPDAGEAWEPNVLGTFHSPGTCSSVTPTRLRPPASSSRSLHNSSPPRALLQAFICLFVLPLSFRCVHTHTHALARTRTHTHTHRHTVSQADTIHAFFPVFPDQSL